ncbi:MAG: tryptophan synthase subunit alpha [Deltaproteobacteria bacterium]|nr:tryptophan synthase subunit alpha [Deltaproteobacteria bacterium]
MSPGRYQALFSDLEQRGEGAFVPFVVLGDPSLGASLEIVEALVRGGADALELGIPFSDPIADGPVIQSAAVRALVAGATTAGCFEVISAVRERHPAIPIGLLVYANLVVAPGPSSFYRRAARAGVDSVLVADVPVFEAGQFVAAAGDVGVDPVLIVPPNADDSRLAQIARAARGYTYVVARSGVTGVNEHLRTDRSELIGRLIELGAPPSLVGFGVSRPDHVRSVLEAGAAGAISGSAVVAIVEQHLERPGPMLDRIREFVGEMKDATREERMR